MQRPPPPKEKHGEGVKKGYDFKEKGEGEQETMGMGG